VGKDENCSVRTLCTYSSNLCYPVPCADHVRMDRPKWHETAISQKLLCARQRTKSCLFPISLKFHKMPIRKLLLLWFFKWESEGFEGLNNQSGHPAVSGRKEIWIQTVWHQILGLFITPRGCNLGGALGCLATFAGCCFCVTLPASFLFSTQGQRQDTWRAMSD
jgi:hypothetical protein